MSAPVGKRGFALPAVLAVTAVVTLVFLVAILALDSLVQQTRRAVEASRFETQALSLEAHAAYLVAVGAPTADAVLVRDIDPRVDARLRIDGTSYSTPYASPLRLALRDEAGLINLDNLPASATTRLLAALGAPVDQRPALVDRFSDYIDVDDLARVDGAEAPAYRDRRLPPPPDAPLRTIHQALGVLGWKTATPRERWRALRDDLTADPTSATININTATPSALKVMYGLTDDQVAAVLDRRRGLAFTGLEDLGRAVGLRLSGDAERLYGFPNGRFALKITALEAGLDYRARIVLTPRDRERPVWIEEPTVSLSPIDERTERHTDAPLFPDPAPSVADPGRPLRDG